MTESVSTPQTGRTWLAQLLSGEPHQVIGHADRPYLLRWYLLKPNRFCNLYFHRFIGSDDPTPHDHPWPFITLVLAGTYIEVDQQHRQRRRRRGSIAFRHVGSSDEKSRGNRYLAPPLFTRPIAL